MIAIANESLPRSVLSYIAFRISFRDTLERLTLASQFEIEPTGGVGFLTEVPFFRQVPPQIQLDLLANTWSRHLLPEVVQATMVDEAVIYAACEYAGDVICEQPKEALRFLNSGPLDLAFPLDKALADQVRSLHLKLPSEGDFLMLSQFEDLPPDEAKIMKRQFGLGPSRVDEMLEVLGRWKISAEFQQRLAGLLTTEERHLLEPLYRMKVN